MTTLGVLGPRYLEIIDVNLFKVRCAEQLRNATAADYDQYVGYVSGRLWKDFRLKDPQAIQSIANETFVKVCNKFNPERTGKGQMESFFCRVLHFTALDYLRRRKVANTRHGGKSFVPLLIDEPCQTDRRSILDHAAVMDELGAIRDFVATLKDPKLKSVGEAIVDQCTTGATTIRQTTGFSLSTTKVLVKRFLALLHSNFVDNPREES